MITIAILVTIVVLSWTVLVAGLMKLIVEACYKAYNNSSGGGAP